MANSASHLEPNSSQFLAFLRETLGDAQCRQLGLPVFPADVKLSVVVPVYNEIRTLPEILRRIETVPIRKEILFIDDCSSDGSRELLRQWTDAAKPEPSSVGHNSLNEIRCFFHEQNQGKGAALRTGFRHVTGTIVVVQDADLEYNPSEYPQLIEPILDGRADVVFGSRFIGQTHRVLFFWHYLGNQLLTLLSNMFTGLNLTDMESCYKVFTREAIDAIAPKLSSDRFGFEPEVTAKVARGKYRVYETPISYAGRTYAEGKKIGWKDGVQALWLIVRYWWAD